MRYYIMPSFNEFLSVIVKTPIKIKEFHNNLFKFFFLFLHKIFNTKMPKQQEKVTDI